MESTQSTRGIHPLIAGAAVSVMLVSLLGTAAIIGVLPNSQGRTVPTAVDPAFAAMPADSKVPTSTALAPVQAYAPAEPKKVVYRAPKPRVQKVVYAQAEPVRQYSAQPVYQQPAPVYRQPAPVAKNSPLGIGVGAVIGGVLGNQIGGGNGKKLATIAGVIGGGYIGNEVAKRNR